MVVERQHVAENGSPAAIEQPFQKINTKRVRALPSQNIYRPPAARRLEALVNSELSPNNVVPVAVKTEKVRVVKQRRPDIQVYVPRAKRASALVDQDAGVQRIQDAGVQRIQDAGVQRIQDAGVQRTQSLRRSLDLAGNSGAVSKSPSLYDRWGSGTIVSTSSERTCNVDPPPTPRVRKLIRHPPKEQTTPVVEPSNGCNSSCSSEVNVSSQDPDNRVSVNGQKEGRTVSVSEEVQYVEHSLQTESSCDVNSPSISESKMDLDRFDPVSECEHRPSESCANEAKKEETLKEIEEHKENTDSSGEVVSMDILHTSDIAKESKKDEDEECRKQEEQNRKNRRILRGSYMSDVLIISDPVDTEPSSPSPPQPSVVEDANKDNGSTTVKKKKVSHKVEIEPAASSSSESRPRLNPDECTWDMMFDDNGECLDPKLMEELTSAVGSVTIAKPQSNYDQYQMKSEQMLPALGDEFAHVIEIYNFPPEFKTQDLLTVFSPYKNSGFEIKWVDDTHALGVFSSSMVAADVLATSHPFVKTRPLREATPESRTKARRSAEFLQPYRARPETCVALARRLVTASLGVRLNTSREEREAEKKLLKEAREKKRLVARQRDDAWEGNIGEK